MAVEGYSTMSATGNFSMEVQQNICNFSGWTSKMDNSHNSKEANIVSWNGREPQVDIRVWYSTDADPIKKPGKGVSLNVKEANMLVDALVALGYGSGGTMTPPPQQAKPRQQSSTPPMNPKPIQPSMAPIENAPIPTLPGMPAFTPLNQGDLPF